MWQIAGTFESSGMIPTFAATTPLLDAYPNAAFAYSFRKLRTAYAGSAVRIRESGGNTEQDFGFDGSGNFDSAGAATFIGANSGFIVTWYDQSGNGLDVTQATAANQPQYDSSGENALFDGSDDELRTTITGTSLGTGTQFSEFVLAKPGSSPSATTNVLLCWIVGTNANDRILNAYLSGTNQIQAQFGSDTNNASGGLLQASFTYAANPHLWEFYRDNGDNQEVLINGSSVASGTRITDITTDSGDFTIGSYPPNPGVINFKGNVSEVIFWGTDLGSSGRSGARTNINSYYSVF